MNNIYHVTDGKEKTKGKKADRRKKAYMKSSSPDNTISSNKI